MFATLGKLTILQIIAWALRRDDKLLEPFRPGTGASY